MLKIYLWRRKIYFVLEIPQIHALQMYGDPRIWLFVKECEAIA